MSNATLELFQILNAKCFKQTQQGKSLEITCHTKRYLILQSCFGALSFTFQYHPSTVLWKALLKDFFNQKL